MAWRRGMQLMCALASLALLASSGPPDSTAPDGTAQEELPRLQFDAQIGGRPTALALDGQWLYLGIGSRLEVLDVSQPGRPTLVGTGSPLPQPIVNITLSSGDAYVADAGGGLYIVDVHDPAQPTEAAAMDLGGSVINIAIDGSTAYVAASDAGLHILDVSDPRNPQEIGSYTANYGVLNAAVVPPIAYVEVDDGGTSRGVRIKVPRLHTLDISDPTNPVELGQADVTAGRVATKPMLLGGAASVYEYYTEFGTSGCIRGGIIVLDVTDPTAPTRTDDLPGSCWGDAMAGSTTLFAVGNQLQDSVWLYRPDAPTPASEIHPGFPVGALALAGSRLFVAGVDDSTGLTVMRVLDIAITGQPALLGNYLEPALTHAQGSVAGQRAFLADRGRFSILDLSQPTIPVEVGSARLPKSPGAANWPNDVAVRDTFAYVADGSLLLTYNVADARQPALLDQRGMDQGMYGLARSGAYLYAIVGRRSAQPGLEYRLVVLDLSDPAHPQPKGDWSDAGGLWGGLAVNGTHLYLVAGRLLNVLDIADPVHPRLVGSAPFSEIGGERVAVAGMTVFVADFAGADAYDVSDPTAPRPLGPIGGDAGYASSVAADGLRLYISYWAGRGVRVYDVSDATAPTPVGNYTAIPNGDIAASVFVLRGHVLTSTYSGLWVLH